MRNRLVVSKSVLADEVPIPPSSGRLVAPSLEFSKATGMIFAIRRNGIMLSAGISVQRTVERRNRHMTVIMKQFAPPIAIYRFARGWNRIVPRVSANLLADTDSTFTYDRDAARIRRMRTLSRACATVSGNRQEHLVEAFQLWNSINTACKAMSAVYRAGNKIEYRLFSYISQRPACHAFR